MKLFRKTGLRMARWGWVNRAIRDHADLEIFKHRPSVRMFIGLGVLTLSMLLGWPAVAVLGAIGIYLEKPLIALVGGPLIYGISWVIYGLAFLISGRDLLHYAHALNRWIARKMVTAMVGDHPIPIIESPQEHTTENNDETDPRPNMKDSDNPLPVEDEK